MKKIILGITEKVMVNGVLVKAKIDTGADGNSICKSLIEKLNLVPTGNRKQVKSSHGTSLREIYKAQLEIKGKRFITSFNVIDRNHLKYSVLIGKNTLKNHDFLVDPSK